MTDKEKIKAEIERLKNELNYESFTNEVLGRRNALNSILSFINSLSEEPVSEDLDEAADKYESEQQEKYKDRDNHDFDNYRDGFVDGLTHVYDAFKAGAKWKKNKALEEITKGNYNSFNKPYFTGEDIYNLYNKTKKQFIEKSCKWLEEYIEPDDFNAMIHDFRKAMEEGV